MKKTLEFTTNLNCNSCVSAVQPFLDSIPGIEHWHVDTAGHNKTLTVSGESVTSDLVTKAVAAAGFVATSGSDPHSKQPSIPGFSASSPRANYYPLGLLLAFLIGIVGLVEFRNQTFDSLRAMQSFMGAFFIAFSFFKLLDLQGFSDSYRMYDVVAKRVPVYGIIYPFIELALGAAYITGTELTLVSTMTFVLMMISSIGVVQTLLSKKSIRCACLGTIFNLPMSTVTLVENGLMFLMAIAMLFIPGH